MTCGFLTGSRGVSGGEERALPQRVVGIKWAALTQEMPQSSETYGLIFGCSCVEPGDGFNNPYRSLPTQGIL